MNKNHITDEILVAWIEEALSGTKYSKVTKHLENCDKCYFRYSTLMESVIADGLAKPKKVPLEIKQFAKEQLGLVDAANTKQSDKLLNKLKNIGGKIPIFRPIPIGAIAISVILLLILTKNPNNLPQSTTFIPTSEEISPISVKIENDSLIISQSINVNNSISIFSMYGDTLLSDEFSEFKKVYPLSKFYGFKKIQILITSQGIAIADTTIIIH